jgi:CubicO group peptidase (beta-lactamase class C family)
MTLKSKTFAFAAALLATTAAHAAVPNDPPFEHKTIPGASPEPITEGAGLKGKEDLEAFFDGVMSAHLLAQRIAGATVAVVKDGELYFTKGYGYADLDKRTPVDPEKTLFRPGSTSKLFTWTSVMQLVEQGKLDLDGDVAQYVNQFKIPEAFGKPITLRNLLTHSGGLEDGGIGYLFAKEEKDLVPLEQALKDHVPARVRPPTTDFTDGMNSSYSNWGTALAGLIVANVSGMSFDEYVEKNILEPLEMTHSTFREPLPPELAPHMSNGYKYEKGAPKVGNFEFIHSFGPAGNLSSTATDMAKFMIAHLKNGEYKGQRILQEETAKYMHARRFSPSPYINGTGLGFYETWINGRRWINHGGDTIYFHTNLSLLEDEKLGVFVSYNSASTHPFSQRDDLLKAFTDRYFPAKLPVVKPPENFKDRAAKFAGTYRVIRHNYTKNEFLFALLSSVSVAPTKENTLMIASMGSPVSTAWVEVAPNVFRKIDDEEIIAFPEDADGNVRGFVWPFPFHAVYKVKWYDGLPWHGFIAALAVLAMVVSLVSVVRNWKADRSAPAAARNARRLAALTALTFVVFLVLVVATFSADIDQLIYKWPPVFKVALAFPLLAIPLTLGVLYFAVRAWREGFWTRYGRIQYGIIAIAFTLFLWSLNYVNLVGYKFG